MSDKLAIAAALSVLMMAAYVLLGAETVRAPLGPARAVASLEAAAPALPLLEKLLPILR